MEQKIELFFKVRPPAVARCLANVREWVLEFAPEMNLAWRWNTVFYQLDGRDCLYILVGPNDQVRVGFVYGSKMKHQNLLDSREKAFVRHFRIEVTASCKKNFKMLLEDAAAAERRNFEK